jgi:hypothetical protein
MRLILTTEDARAKADVEACAEKLEKTCFEEFGRMYAEHAGGYHPQRHLSVVQSALATVLNRAFTQMYKSVGIERTKADQDRFMTAMNAVIADESKLICAKHSGEVN